MAQSLSPVYKSDKCSYSNYQEWILANSRESVLLAKGKANIFFPNMNDVNANEWQPRNGECEFCFNIEHCSRFQNVPKDPQETMAAVHPSFQGSYILR